MFHRLPAELVFEFLPFLAQHDLTQMVLVSRLWYNLFISQLYRQVMLPLHDYCDTEHDSIRWSKDLPVRRFTTALLNNPALAPFIRSLKLYASDSEGNQQYRSPLQPVAEATYRHFMLPYGDARRKHRRKFHIWQRDLTHSSERQDGYQTHRYEDAWLALLMVQLNNLEEFAIALAEEWDHNVEEGEVQLKKAIHFERVLQWASNSKLGILARLKHVSLSNGPAFWQGGTAVNAVSLNRILPFIRLPSVRKLCVKDVCDRAQFHLPKGLVFPLTHLDLRMPNDGLPHLPRLLERCPKLQSLTLEMGDWGEDRTHDYLDYSALHRPLQRSKDSLRHLHLTFQEHQTWQEADTPTPAFFGSLAEFANLQTVHMRWSNLMPFLKKKIHNPTIPLRKVLPYSLQHLWIDDCLIQCSLSLCTEIESLLVDLSMTFPLLETLYIRYAAKEYAYGERCIRGVGGNGSDWRVMKADPIIGHHLLELQGEFRALGVLFWVIQTADTVVSFPPDGAIRKKWDEGSSDRLLE
ncbi:hypothetical protein AbraIFM66951_005251 [Aspergillus brasiliensis]|uniref:F-box domain-containing protein n=1 Tax=Aspergillus brasiliensis TaxID=319629 RepID=A0A9W6DTA7_9EURO|nr:hypothetical protein AbraCBS73388_003491 [Aspergillus brasiliensis]GKZ51204.1 hypothetical protein AbraIFM66951_005251 [Aspergillus brasiliensis]